jgi:hypothetical protein
MTNSKTILVKKSLLKSVLYLFLIVSLFHPAHSQKITGADLKKLRASEDTLKEYAQYLNTDSLTEDRMISDSIFTRTLVRALQIKNSFYYPFDSVMGISKLYAPDSSFRIFTWEVQYESERIYSLQKGAIQLPTKDGSLKLFRLLDVCDPRAIGFTDKPEDSVRNNMNWIGAVYYNMVKTQYNGKKYYTLFGFDENSVRSSMKWIDVLSFNEKNEPVFGGPFFSYAKDSIARPTRYRFGIEYKKGASVLVNYIDELQLILVDHLVSDNDNADPDLPWTFVPDGDQEGFKWQNGKWTHVDKVFTFKLQDGQAPFGNLEPDMNENKVEKKLPEKTDKNKIKDKKKDQLNYDN